MKILLINPSCVMESGRDLYSAHLLGQLYTMQPGARMTLGIPLALPTLAAHTPPEHDVKILDEEIENIDFAEPADIVGITAMSFKARRAYEIAREFRSRGVKVVMGGIHASMAPDEAARYVDSVVVGEAEEIWPTLIADAADGNLRARYVAESPPDLKQAGIPRYDLVANSHYLYSYLQTTRGCPFDCTFCTVTKMSGRKVRKKTPDQVIAELDKLLGLSRGRQFTVNDRTSGARKRFVGMIAFIDDNFAIDRRHALAVCRAIKRYQEEHGIVFSWYTQVNYEVGFDDELLTALGESGCQHLFVGFESLDPATLHAMNKDINSPEKYGEAIRNIHRRGIRVVYSTIVGNDHDGEQTAQALTAFVEQHGVFHVLLNILTPYLGTDLYNRMNAEGRILTTDSQRYNIRNVVFRPSNMAPEKLFAMYRALCQDLYQYDKVIRRGQSLLNHKGPFTLPLVERLAVWVGFTYTTIVLAGRGQLRSEVAWKLLRAAPARILFDGNLSSLELLVASADYDDFARSESRRTDTIT